MHHQKQYTCVNLVLDKIQLIIPWIDQVLAYEQTIKKDYAGGTIGPNFFFFWGRSWQRCYCQWRTYTIGRCWMSFSPIETSNLNLDDMWFRNNHLTSNQISWSCYLLQSRHRLATEALRSNSTRLFSMRPFKKNGFYVYKSATISEQKENITLLV